MSSGGGRVALGRQAHGRFDFVSVCIFERGVGRDMTLERRFSPGKR